MRRGATIRRGRGGGLATFVLLLPLLLTFGYFSWYPIGRAVVMSFQQTNLVTAPEWVGLENFRHVLEDPRFWTAIRNTVSQLLEGCCSCPIRSARLPPLPCSWNSLTTAKRRQRS